MTQKMSTKLLLPGPLFMTKLSAKPIDRPNSSPAVVFDMPISPADSDDVIFKLQEIRQ